MNAFISFIDKVIYIDIENILDDFELYNLKNRLDFIIDTYKASSIKVRCHNNINHSKYNFLENLIVN